MGRHLHRRVAALAASAGLLAAGLVGASATAAYAATFTQNSFSITVNGSSAALRANVGANPRTTVNDLKFCTRNSGGTIVDYTNPVANTIPTTGITISRTTVALPAGSYTSVPCTRVGSTGSYTPIGATKSFTIAAQGSTVTPLPGQPALTAYGASVNAVPFQHEGALIIAGRDQYNEQPFKDASAAGATVLMYIDPVIDAAYGRYHTVLNQASTECGSGVTARWPGNYTANSYGYLNDFRVGSVLQAKWRCTLELMVAENPHMGGFFLDDVGSRSWYPGFDWSTFGAQNQTDYRAGAIALVQTAHEVAVAHGLMVMVNGTWSAGSLSSNGGGYPDVNQNGISTADGGYIEHHTTSELSYFKAYAVGQWGTAAGDAAQGKPIMYVQASDEATRAAYANAGVFAYLSAQQDYDGASVWGPFHPTGLPSHTS